MDNIVFYRLALKKYYFSMFLQSQNPGFGMPPVLGFSFAGFRAGMVDYYSYSRATGWKKLQYNFMLATEVPLCHTGP